jgi:hypothetical protein
MTEQPAKPPFRLGFLTHVQGRGDLAAAERFPVRGAFPEGIGQEEALRRFHSFYGHPDEVTEALSREKALPVATDLITQFNPAVPEHDAAIRALELIATEVAPALGWRPSPGPDAAPAGTRAGGRLARTESTP